MPAAGIRVALTALAFITWATAAPARAEQNGKFSGWLLWREGYGLDAGNRQMVLNQQLLQIQWTRPEVLGWRIDAKLWAERESRLEPKVYSNVVLRELLFTRENSTSSLTLGRQIVIWGKADGFRLLDVVNPLDLREFVLGDDLRSRRPLWMVNAQFYHSSDEQLQFVLIPQSYHDRLPGAGGEFDPYISLRQSGVNLLTPEVPGNRAANWSYGARWALSSGAVDLSLIALRNLNGTPVLFTSLNASDTLQVQPRVTRRNLLGIAADWNTGPSVVRGEVAFSPDEYRTFVDPNGVPYQRRRAAVRTLVGVDWYVHNWIVSPQLFNCHAPGTPGVGSEPDGTYASLMLNRKFYFDKLTFRLFDADSVSRYDYWLSVSLRYQLRGDLEIFLSGDWLGGNNAGFFGQFGDRDRIVAGIKGYL